MVRETGLDWLQFDNQDTLTGYNGAESINEGILVGQREYGTDAAGSKTRTWTGYSRTARVEGMARVGQRKTGY